MTKLWSQKQSKLPCRNSVLGTPLPGPQGPATPNCTCHFGHGALDAIGRTPAAFGERASAGPQQMDPIRHLFICITGFQMKVSSGSVWFAESGNMPALQ